MKEPFTYIRINKASYIKRIFWYFMISFFIGIFVLIMLETGAIAEMSFVYSLILSGLVMFTLLAIYIYRVRYYLIEVSVKEDDLDIKYYDNFKIKNKKFKNDQINIRYDFGIFGSKDKVLILEDKSTNEIILKQYKIGEWIWDFNKLSREINKIKNA